MTTSYDDGIDRALPLGRGIREVLESAEDIEYTCPRCGEAATGRFYGPCTKCRTELRAGFTIEPKRFVAEYEPPTVSDHDAGDVF